MIGRIAKLLKILNSETEPHQISAGLSLAMIFGLTPLFAPHNALVLLLVLVLRVNLSAFILGWLLFSGIAYLLDPIFHAIGYACLTATALEALWTSLYNLPLLRLTGFNNSLVMGSLLVSLVLFFPLFLLANFIIRKYREHLLAWIRETRLARILQSTRIFSAYKAISERSWS
ncbi:MAG: TIGR03546 family protein [Desulfosudaceae bacterium]